MAEAIRSRRCRRWPTELGIADLVVFHGRIPLDDVPAAVAAADIGIAPTRRDQFTDLSLSTKVYEYAAMGKAVVATRLPLVERTFPTGTVWTYAPGDAASMASAIAAVADDEVTRDAAIERTQVIVARGRLGTRIRPLPRDPRGPHRRLTGPAGRRRRPRPGRIADRPSTASRPRMLGAMSVEASGPGTRPVLRFQRAPDPEPEAGVTVVVIDTTWTPAPRPTGDAPDTRVVSLRPVVARILAERDLVAESLDRLDSWADAAGVVAAMSIEGTSFWFQGRVGYWSWLHEHLLWLAIVDDLVGSVGPSAIECEADCDALLLTTAEAIAARDGLPFLTRAVDVVADDPPEPAPPPPAVAKVEVGAIRRLARRFRRLVRPNRRVSRKEVIADRFESLSHEPGRLLVVLTHARQAVQTRDGTRQMNAYLGPVVDRLRSTALDPIEIHTPARLADDADWAYLSARGSERTLPGDVIKNVAPIDDPEPYRVRAAAVADAIVAAPAKLEAAGVDLGPLLAAHVADRVRTTFGGQARTVPRLRALIDRLQPAAVLLADEYHRQDWLTAARLEGVPTIAIQHGIIHPWHPGYVMRERPAELRLPDRTYVFGAWERRLLTETSIYREDEVRVGGSPRLDLVDPDDTDRASVRSSLGVAPEDRLVVISGTWGGLSRRFHYPVALAGLMDRPLPRVHVVVKLHPGEPDAGPYQAVIEGVAKAGGFAPPAISIVQTVDLHRLLRAADAHVGVYSTVLTEAVVAGAPNLLASMFASSDMLGYVAAGVAVPIRDGGDLLAALDRRAGIPTPAAREAFVDAHFRPGIASERIADEILVWPT